MGLYSGTGVIFGMLIGLHIWGRIFGGRIKGEVLTGFYGMIKLLLYNYSPKYRHCSTYVEKEVIIFNDFLYLIKQ